MKKLDKLVLSSFLGPFILTFLVVVFILLTQHMLKYFDDIIGKGLGFDVIGQLLFYFAIFMTPIAMPLAVLLSSLITFGNLGEHFELTAIKASGISLLRTIQPIFFFVVLLTMLAFYINNNLVPKAALEAYSLLYDIKQKKPALDLREGAFYNGIPDISIKVNKKFEDGITLKDIIIYDHRKQDGNKDVTVADSGKMYTILNERYLKLELFRGYNYSEGTAKSQDVVAKKPTYGTETMSRSKFAKSQFVFDLSSFQLSRTDKKWFQGNRIMRKMSELDHDLDSLKFEKLSYKLGHYQNYYTFFNFFSTHDSITMPYDLKVYLARKDSLDELQRAETQKALEEEKKKSLAQDTIETQAEISGDTLSPHTDVEPIDSIPPSKPVTSVSTKAEDPRLLRTRRLKGQVKGYDVNQPDTIQLPDSLRVREKEFILTDSAIQAKLDSVFAIPLERLLYTSAVNKARVVKSQLNGAIGSMDVYDTETRVFRIQWHKIMASSLACIAMFLIGAPLGAIIKKGGLGVPFLVSILFFIIYYLLTMTGEKWAKQGFIGVEIGVWAADVILFIIGMLFLRQARVDARLFDSDFYQVVLDKIQKWLIARKILKPTLNH
jgi:lipopolysaccharide export system permease protein